MNGRALVLALVTLAACTHVRPPAPARPPAASPARAPAPAPLPAPAPASPFFAPAALAGCTATELEAQRDRYHAVGESLSGREPKGGLPHALAELAVVWKSPCFVHVARFFPPPKARSEEELRELWHAGLAGMKGLLGGLYVRDGRRYLVVPPTAATVDDALRKKLAPRLCPDAETHCGNAGTFVARAEEAFDHAMETRLAWHADRGWPLCDGAEDRDENSSPKLTRWEAWARCVAVDTPRTWRYPPLRYRAPERGWLVMRGRRGHYSFADEVRAYDLATGAAYVSRSESALVLGGSVETFGVDRKATDAQRKPDAFTGNVAPDVVRELAFVLETIGVAEPVRTRMILVPVPADLEVTLSERPAGFAFDIAESSWGTSAQTSIGWSLVDEGKLVDDGRFTWPDSSDPGEEHADGVVRVLEAGLERGCARATLPERLGKGSLTGVSSIDADQGALVGTAADLERALGGLRSRPSCPRPGR